MGSAAPKVSGYDMARAMLQEVEEETRAQIEELGEADPVALLLIIDAHLDSPHRNEIRRYVAAYLARCLLGTIPDHRRWEPF